MAQEPWTQEEEAMDQEIIRRFPFLADIFSEEYLASINNAMVIQGDRSLLDIKPGAWAHDGERDCHEGYCLFWGIAPDNKIVPLESGWSRTIPHEVEKSREWDVNSIGSQLSDLKSDIQFIVEIYAESWSEEEDKIPHVVIYDMGHVNPRGYYPASLRS